MINNKFILATCLILSFTNVNSMYHNSQNDDPEPIANFGQYRHNKLINIHYAFRSPSIIRRQLIRFVPEHILTIDFGPQAKNWQLQWTEYFLCKDPLNLAELYTVYKLDDEFKKLLLPNVPQSIIDLQFQKTISNSKISWMHYYLFQNIETAALLFWHFQYSIRDFIQMIQLMHVPQAIVCFQFGENAKDWQPTWAEYYINMCGHVNPENERAWASLSYIAFLCKNQVSHHALNSTLSKKISKPIMDKYYPECSIALTLKAHIILNVRVKHYSILKNFDFESNFFTLWERYKKLCRLKNIRCEFFHIRDYIRYYNQPLAISAGLYRNMLNKPLPHAILTLNSELNSKRTWSNYGHILFCFRQKSFRYTNMVCASPFDHIADIGNEIQWQPFDIE